MLAAEPQRSPRWNARDAPGPSVQTVQAGGGLNTISMTSYAGAPTIPDQPNERPERGADQTIGAVRLGDIRTSLGTIKCLQNKGTWCSWLSRSLSIRLREVSGSIPDVSRIHPISLDIFSSSGLAVLMRAQHWYWQLFAPASDSGIWIGNPYIGRFDLANLHLSETRQPPQAPLPMSVRRGTTFCLPSMGTWCSWLSRSLRTLRSASAKGVRFNSGCVHSNSHRFHPRLPFCSCRRHSATYANGECDSGWALGS
ncbi:hypothetical protein DENSPDRAFT_710064 [Dentipellis sp. KUC8613]|nr:hypothetical protein DENSPDRAFT_710064 [Dentipellis sp. KUC8613]